ncbi:hypothetical protein [Candidatus Phytoplasma gossypii]|uniref:Uncharacterized protein n=1 Tax=Candidatus Phytoplasma gossypii TaxID=2982629 RepID=A0ABT9D1U3_9MOLU|nr:hypothetical protein ['Gossypium sp.' phytoplasma]MDO8057199.1 hypothetical protein ['Gossypium sp.' phytoplasma]
MAELIKKGKPIRKDNPEYQKAWFKNNKKIIRTYKKLSEESSNTFV